MIKQINIKVETVINKKFISPTLICQRVLAQLASGGEINIWEGVVKS